MVAAIELYFDQSARGRIRSLWDAFEEAGIPSLRDLTHGQHQPHMSLIGAAALDPDVVKAALDGFVVDPLLAVRLDYIGVFLGRILWLGPVPTTELLEHQRQVFTRLAQAGIEIDPYYQPGSWVPHSTMSLRIPHKRMSDAIRLCMDVLPIEAAITGAAVADYARGIYRSF